MQHMNYFYAFLFLLFSSLCFSQEIDTVKFYSPDNNKPSNVAVFKSNKDSIVFFKADFDIDADGSPRAYNKSNTGLLHNDNGRNINTKSWFAIVVTNGIPVEQDSTCPYPGYYISTTSLTLSTYSNADYRKYINSEKIPYFVLPGGMPAEFKQMGIRLGDIGLIYNTENKKYSFAIFADIGPKKIIGEGSIKLAEDLGIPIKIDSKGRIRGGIEKNTILYIIFPNSGNKSYNNINCEMIDTLGIKALKNTESMDFLIQRAIEITK